MTTWTESARSALEGHLSQMRENLHSSGADPMEVTDDLRRHIDEEVAARKIGVVTTEDVESILQRIGLPAAPTNGRVGVGRRLDGETAATGVDSEFAAGPDSSDTPWVTTASKGKWHRWLFFLGVALPALTLAIEWLTHMCSAAFFDPIPGLWDLLLVASVPVANFVTWRAVRLQRILPGCWLGIVSAYSLGVGAYYSLLYATLAPFAALAVIFFGWGLLPLSPILALIAAWRLRLLAGRIPGVEGQGGLRGWGWGLGVAAIALALVVLPPPLTRLWARAAVAGDREESTRALRWLRAYGHERTLLADCYGTTRWALDNPFQFHAQGTPISAEVARGLFYRVTGHAFNEFPPPQAGHRGRTWEGLREFEWDSDQGGTAVGGRLRGLSVGQSRLDGLIDGDAGWAYTEWILEFKNVSAQEREARGQIALPPGGVVSRVTLWVNGEEREAAFAGSGEVRAAYEKVVKVYRRDPILVTYAGEDRVLMQCYPVPPNGGTMKIRLGITAPVELENSSTAILRWPRFIERNFSVPDGIQHAVWVESSQAVAASHPKLTQDHSKPGVIALRGMLTDSELGQPGALVRIPRSASARTAWVPDPHASDGAYVRQELVEKPARRPGRIVLVIDGSKPMDEVLPVVAEALPQLPEGVEFSLLFARDQVEEFSGVVRKTDAAFLQEVAGRLGRARGVGGQDNLLALVRGWDLAAGQTNSVVLWIHGPQPVELENSEVLYQRLTWRWPRAGSGPWLHELQVAVGANRLTDQVGLLAPVQALPRFGSVKEDLQRLFASWRGEAQALSWHRERLTADGGPEAERGKKSSKHLARLWAKDEVARLVAGQKREDAVQIAAKYQLVTSVSGAVVLENRQQFEQAGLKPVASDTVPTVPEPGVIALLVLGAAALAGRRWVGHRTARRQSMSNEQ